MSVVTEQLRRRSAAATARPTPRLTDRIGDEVSVAIGIMWIVGYLAAGALEPETHESLPMVAIVLSVAFYAALVATAIGLAARRRWGITASLGASAVFLAGSVACPTTGHHQMGVWWLGQMAVALALVVGSVMALQLSRPPSAGGPAARESAAQE